MHDDSKLSREELEASAPAEVREELERERDEAKAQAAEELEAHRDETHRELELEREADEAAGPAERPAEADALDAQRDTEQWRALLELNGFNTIRREVLGVAGAAGAIPLETIDAAIEHTKRAIARLTLNADNPRAPEARRNATYELRILELVRTFRRELGRADEAQAASDKLNGTGGQG